MTISSATATTLSFSWSSAGSVIESYTVLWARDSFEECVHQINDSFTLTGSLNSYVLTGLEEDSNYMITVTATNVAGSTATGDPVIGRTLPSSKSVYASKGILKHIIPIHSSIASI